MIHSGAHTTTLGTTDLDEAQSFTSVRQINKYGNKIACVFCELVKKNRDYCSLVKPEPEAETMTERDDSKIQF